MRSKKRYDVTRENPTELQNLLSTTINSLSDWIHVVDADLQVIMMNDALKGMMKSLGFRNNLDKRKLKEVFPFLSPGVIHEYQRVFKTGKSLVTEDLMVFEGRKIYSETIKEPVLEEDKVVRVITVIRDITIRKQAEEAMKESEKQLKIFAERLQTIREEERVVISRELHDDLGQNLTALRFEIVRLIKRINDTDKPPDLASLVNEASEMTGLIDASLQMARKISRELRPRILDELGLVPAIEWQVNEFIKRTSIPGLFHSDLQEIEIEGHKKIAVFRIIQEALTNIMRHAHATQVIVTVARKNKCIVIEVKDNGAGIRENELTGKNSFGLTIMRERAILLGGILKIKGIPGKGTSVVLSIPVKEVAD